MKGPDVQVRRGDGAKRQGPLVKQPKAHHFVPVAHLVRFSAGPEAVPSRDRVLHLYDKRTGLFRSAKARNVAYENDLYTIRAPDLSGVEPEPGQLHRAVFDPANKDADIEARKIGIEAAGLEVMREIDGWDSGPREVGHEQKAALHTYMGLLLAQHPTMMGARAVAIQQRFWASAAARGKPVPALQAMFDELSAGAGVLALVMDAFATALELNYLAWKVIRWPEGPRLILGDVGVAAAYPPGLLGVGDSWADDAKFFLPIGPNTLVVVGGLAPGRCVV